MHREEKSERSRRQVLDAALDLFSRHGYRATSVREIAERAGASVGAVYHHFPDKETIFRALLDEYSEVTRTERFPFTRVLVGPDPFPDNIEELGFAARDSVRQFRSYIALIYVDVIEFGGTHIRDFYSDLSRRLTEMLERTGRAEEVRKRLRAEVSASSALLLTARLFFNYFQMEILFGVTEPFGKDSVTTVREIADIIRNGICL